VEGGVLNARRLFFSRVPLTWQEWVDFWQKDHEGQGQPHLLSDSVMLVPFDEEQRPHLDGEALRDGESNERASSGS
jgi:hypothetical protein